MAHSNAAASPTVFSADAAVVCVELAAVVAGVAGPADRRASVISCAAARSMPKQMNSHCDTTFIHYMHSYSHIRAAPRMHMSHVHSS